MARLKIRLDDVPEAGLELRVDHHDPTFAQALLDACDGRPGATGEAVLQLQSWPGRLDVVGLVRFEVPLVCSRGLETYKQPVELRFEQIYSRGYSVSTDDEVELQPEDLDRLPLIGDEVDLAPALREEVILAVPMKPLCVTPCDGPCPSWGAALDLENKPAEVVDPRWGALSGWKRDP